MSTELDKKVDQITEEIRDEVNKALGQMRDKMPNHKPEFGEPGSFIPYDPDGSPGFRGSLPEMQLRSCRERLAREIERADKAEALAEKRAAEITNLRDFVESERISEAAVDRGNLFRGLQESGKRCEELRAALEAESREAEALRTENGLLLDQNETLRNEQREWCNRVEKLEARCRELRAEAPAPHPALDLVDTNCTGSWRHNLGIKADALAEDMLSKLKSERERADEAERQQATWRERYEQLADAHMVEAMPGRKSFLADIIAAVMVGRIYTHDKLCDMSDEQIGMEAEKAARNLVDYFTEKTNEQCEE